MESLEVVTHFSSMDPRMHSSVKHFYGHLAATGRLGGTWLTLQAITLIEADPVNECERCFELFREMQLAPQGFDDQTNQRICNGIRR
jgi:hypothetical protein